MQRGVGKTDRTYFLKRRELIIFKSNKNYVTKLVYSYVHKFCFRTRSSRTHYFPVVLDRRGVDGTSIVIIIIQPSIL